MSIGDDSHTSSTWSTINSEDNIDTIKQGKTTFNIDM